MIIGQIWASSKAAASIAHQLQVQVQVQVLKFTVDLVLHSSHRAECFLYLYTATAVCRSTRCSGL